MQLTSFALSFNLEPGRTVGAPGLRAASPGGPDGPATGTGLSSLSLKSVKSMARVLALIAAATNGARLRIDAAEVGLEILESEDGEGSVGVAGVAGVAGDANPGVTDRGVDIAPCGGGCKDRPRWYMDMVSCAPLAAKKCVVGVDVKMDGDGVALVVVVNWNETFSG